MNHHTTSPELSIAIQEIGAARPDNGRAKKEEAANGEVVKSRRKEAGHRKIQGLRLENRRRTKEDPTHHQRKTKERR